MSRAGAAALLLACCLILGLLGPLEPVTTDLGAGLALAAWLVFRRTSSFVLPVALLAIPLVLGFEETTTRLALLAAAALAIPATRRCDAAFVGALLGWRLAWQGSPWLASWEVEFSRIISRMIGVATGQQIDFGPAATGLEIFLIFLMWAVCMRTLGGDWSHRRFLVSVAALFVYIALVPSAALSPHVVPLDHAGLFNMANEHLAPKPDQIARVIFGWLPVLFAALCITMLSNRPEPRGGRSGLHVRIAVPVLCLAFIALHWQTSRREEGRRPGQIVILKAPTFDMEVPAEGRFGAGRAGMFGMLPRYLALDGHLTRVHDGAVTPELLADASLLMVILPPAPLSGTEVARIREFVAGGGSLLVLGDHTDLLGTMIPINRLLDPFGMALRFDSAYPAVREWRGSLVGPGLVRSSFSGIGTGASLQTWGATRPLVIGRYALSDAGDRTNTGRGAGLGDYSYRPGERLSDIVLAAERVHGRGRVVAFGDTSSFQNLMLPRSWPFVSRLVDDLTQPTPAARGLPSSGAVLAAGALGLLALAGSSLSSGGLAFAVLIAGLVAPHREMEGELLGRAQADARVALIDTRHLNRFSREFWQDDSVAGLLVSLQREGFLPLLSDEVEATSPLHPAQMPVLIAPRARLSASEAAHLARHLSAGGEILVAAGAAERDALEPLLSRFGLSIGVMPLGPLPIRPDLDPAVVEQVRKEPQFREAHPIGHDGRPGFTSYYREFDHDIVAALTVVGTGSRPGRLLLIADGAFLTDRVLENETSAWEGNVALLGDLLDGEDPP